MNDLTDAQIRLKRLRMRSWRRGIKEMDMILGPFADAESQNLDDAMLDLYEEMLEENDQELYKWVSGQAAVPERFSDLISRISRHAHDH